MSSKPIFLLASFLIISLTSLVKASTNEDPHHPKVFFPRKASTDHEDATYWRTKAEQEIEATKKILESINTNIAKNIIIFVGDGMSLPTVTAARIYQAQYEGRKGGKDVNGEESLLTFETFPHVGLSKTYCVNAQTPDSAATASAMFTGVKTDYYTMGFDNSIELANVSSEATATRVDSIFKWAQDAGKDTGFVTTTRVSHATPGALYAHSAERYWECNKPSSDGTAIDSEDITWQLVNSKPGRNAKVILGGGRSSFLPATQTEVEAHYNYSTVDWDCLRKDELNLIQQFLRKGEEDPEFNNTKGKLVENRGALNEVDVHSVDYLLGLFSWGYMKYEHQREKGKDLDTEEPSLSEMTEVAIKMLQKNQEKGFFLLVEGGKIDVAHHDGWANTALHETMAMDKAVQTAIKLTDPKETLIIVTADHGHTMSMGGYQTRGTDIRDVVDNEQGKDNLPYNILTYANGPGFYDHLSAVDGHVVRQNISSMPNHLDFEFHQPSSAPLKSETHSGSDVGIFATGPYAHFFHGVHEQNYIAYVMAYSACIGPYEGDKCHTKDDGSNPASVPMPAAFISLFLIATLIRL